MSFFQNQRYSVFCNTIFRPLPPYICMGLIRNARAVLCFFALFFLLGFNIALTLFTSFTHNSAKTFYWFVLCFCDILICLKNPQFNICFIFFILQSIIILPVQLNSYVTLFTLGFRLFLLINFQKDFIFLLLYLAVIN